MSISERIKSLFRRKKTHNGDFVRRRRYRLTLVNLSSLRTVFEFRARRLGLVMAAIGLFLFVGAIWLLAVLYTPVRNVLPMRLTADLREKYADMSERLDSISSVQAINERYAQNIMAILGDSVPEPQPAQEVQQTIPLDSLLEATEQERNFVRQYEDDQRYSLSVLSPIAAEGMTFYPPVSGVDVLAGQSERGIPVLQASAARQFPVSAVYRGTVLTSYYVTGRGISLVVQHPNEFVSIYTGLDQAYVARGEKVTAGQRLGMASSKDVPFAMELWRNGTPLSPEDYIP